jgi:hypothetical protein
MREQGMGFILNAFDPMDVFSDKAANIHLLGDDEYYLFESFGIRNDQLVEEG